jgi:predicted transcriptional regulator
MAQSVVVTARVSAELHAQLEEVAASYERPRGWVVARALERYLAEELDLIRSLDEADAAIAAGRVHTQAEVEAMFGIAQEDRTAA